MSEQRSMQRRARRDRQGSVRAARVRSERPAESMEERRAHMTSALVYIVAGALILLLIGLTMVFSATAPSAIRYAHANGEAVSYDTSINQVIYAVLGLVLAGIVAFLNVNLLRNFADLILIFGIMLQLLVLTPLGHGVAGNTNWVRLGGIQIQPSEFLKLATIVWLGQKLARIGASNWNIRYIFAPSWLKHTPLRQYAGPQIFPPLFGVGAALLAVLAGGDMGTALVFALICAGILWISGMPKKYYLYGGGLGLFGVLVLISMNPSRLTRIRDYLGSVFGTPDTIDPTQADYALWAFGSGGLTGTGPGTSVEKWPGALAEAQNDFIFAVIGEEFGLFGCLVVLMMFGLLAYGLFKVVLHHPDRFGRLTCGGIAVWLVGQAIANMMVVTGVLPVFGVPLPLISQGGSAVVACLLAVGVAISCILSVDGMRESLRVSSRLASRAQAVVKG